LVQLFSILIALFSPSAFASGNMIGGGTLLLFLLAIAMVFIYVVVRIYKGSRKIVKYFNNRYISIEEVSRATGESVDSLLDKIKAGKLKGKEFKSGWFVSREELFKIKN
jgi:hypothetical protein